MDKIRAYQLRLYMLTFVVFIAGRDVLSKESSSRSVQDSYIRQVQDSYIRQEGKNSVGIKPQLADPMQQANRSSIINSGPQVQ
jgi:hypothetical protein